MRKIRVYPTPSQKQTLNRWLGVYRWTYNQCVTAIKKGTAGYSLAELRNKFVNASSLVGKSWVTDVPYDVRGEAVRDLIKAKKAYDAKRTKNQTGFALSFKGRLHEQPQSMTIFKKHWGRKRGEFASLFGQGVLASSKTEPLPKTLPADSRLLRDRLGHFDLCIPLSAETRAPAPTGRHRVVAIDPGVRTFLTCYSPTAGLVEFGASDGLRLQRLDSHLDALRSRMETVTHRHRRNMRKAALRIEARIRNLVDDVHKKAACWLLRNYSEILLPSFQSGKMVQKVSDSGKRRTLGKTTVRNMQHWSHCRFRDRLQNAARSSPGSKVTLVTEEYTSITCGVCGFVNAKFSSKSFVCTACSFACDRDLNGSRNILIKHLSQGEAAHQAALPVPSAILGQEGLSLQLSEQTCWYLNPAAIEVPLRSDVASVGRG